jgi:hypothetical protein
MTLKKEVKKINTVINGQSLSQNKEVEDKKKNDCGCGCLANQKKQVRMGESVTIQHKVD